MEKSKTVSGDDDWSWTVAEALAKDGVPPTYAGGVENRGEAEHLLFDCDVFDFVSKDSGIL